MTYSRSQVVLFLCILQSSLEQERLGGAVENGSGTVTLNTGLGDNVNLNLMPDISDDDDGQVQSKIREFSFKRNCVMRRWKSETLKWIINHEVNKVN